jgi:hypothetical protein
LADVPAFFPYFLVIFPSPCLPEHMVSSFQGSGSGRDGPRGASGDGDVHEVLRW